MCQILLHRCIEVDKLSVCVRARARTYIHTHTYSHISFIVIAVLLLERLWSNSLPLDARLLQHKPKRAARTEGGLGGGVGDRRDYYSLSETR